MTAITPAELISLLRDETYTDWKLEADAAELIEQQVDLLSAAEAKRADLSATVQAVKRWREFFDMKGLTESQMYGLGGLDVILSAASVSALDSVRADAVEQASLDAAADYEANGLPTRRLLDRAERIGTADGS